ncbi:ubiquitin-protein ligase E3A [Chelonus insularis]|uniref:ubiquitin-protein ligase E3A n=1 Tax=Chelonus insularis TaxID=460826 RepID=UPI00158A08C0|nr:ubiquitin-protein ligase E3A [Chelonus insularis]XP_034937132.1 ubiquitin-protein ligase E3A [Chelonus insularis]XP_034937134.1 ubiquitin-protein ligase E3A [Chelonus insularis]XP_034937135.1 ubiquitin-protein ligase E3A [Chelonus insularis]XP_034937136.1 ubiquitin-protein ligase E3A [Chelonus insularis]
MNGKAQEDPAEDFTSRVEVDSPCSDMKRAAAKKLIERYFYQLTDGCGNPQCDNQYCASSGKVTNLTPNQAAAQAIQLFSQEARLCDGTQPSKIPRTSSLESGPASLAKSLPTKIMNPSSSVEDKPIPYLTEAKLLDLIESCKVEGSYSSLIRSLGEVFSSSEALSRSFQKVEQSESPLVALLERAPVSLLQPPGDLSKEAVRSLQGEDKDIDSSDPSIPSLDDTNVDLEAVRRSFAALWTLPGEEFESALVNALVTLADNIELDLRVFGVMSSDSTDSLLNVFLIVFEIPVLGSSEYLEYAFHMLCKAVSCLPVSAQAKLARIWARHCKSRLPSLLQALQQLITVKIIGGAFTRDYCVQDADTITAPTKVMKILYYASMLAGEIDPPEVCRDEDTETLETETFDLNKEIGRAMNAQIIHDPLAVELGISALDARLPLISFTDFYNELLSDTVEMDKDFAYYKSEQPKKFSFMNYSFILTPATKTLGLYYDNRIRMYSERRMSIFQSLVGQPTNPYLRLKVRRDFIIEDALVELEMIAMENPTDLKKQLVVEFEGEQGVDEGGVSKEFFQLVVEEIFNPDYGMFILQEETQTTWFNPTSFESDAQFTLIGVVLGLAIYNNVILDVRFPMVVYRKLLGRKGSFADLQDWSPLLYRTLTEIMEYNGDDMVETFMQTFKVGYKDVFGSILFHELCENGDEIYVNQSNRKEFIKLYSDFLLNQSVERQFKAFRRGFQMVTDESPLALLFRPEEIEQLVCGSKVFDFTELEASTEYDGYTSDSEAIKNFWRVAHSLPLESQRRLLQFTTGSDRVPVGGLSRLKMVISRHGPDSDRLPIAHTCFNTLLLPDYASLEKLEDRLLKAINYSKGFGML